MCNGPDSYVLSAALRHAFECPVSSVQPLASSVQCLGVVQPGVAMAMTKKQVIKKIMSHLDTLFTGSGDLEKDDAVDVQEYLTKTFGEKHNDFKVVLQGIMAKVETLDPSWLVCRGPWQTTYPAPPPPDSGEVTELYISPWQTGFGKNASIKGKSNTVNILGVVEDFLDQPYRSADEPIRVLNPKSAVTGTQLQDFSLRLDIGLSKSLATKLIPLACHHLNLSDEEVRLILPELKAVFRVKATFSPASSMKEQIKQSIGSKMQVSERPRPTPVQLAYAWMERCKEEGQNYGEVIDEYIREYNMDSTERKLVTDLEADVVKVLPLQTEECQNKVEYHWQNFKPKKSAIPLHYLGNKAWTNGSVPRPVSSALWKEIQRPTPDKRAACVFRWIGVFIANIKNAARLKKKVNLKASA